MIRRGAVYTIQLLIVPLVLLWPGLSATYPVFDDLVLTTCSECHTQFEGSGEATHDLHTADPGIFCTDCHDLVPDIPDTDVCTACHGLQERRDLLIGLHMESGLYTGDSDGKYCNSSGCHSAWSDRESDSWGRVKSLFR